MSRLRELRSWKERCSNCSKHSAMSAIFLSSAATRLLLPTSMASKSILGLHRSLNSCSRSEEHTSELQSLMRISYAVFCLKKKKQLQHINTPSNPTLTTTSGYLQQIHPPDTLN